MAIDTIKFSDGTIVPEIYCRFAIQFLKDMEEQFGTDFVDAPKYEVSL